MMLKVTSRTVVISVLKTSRRTTAVITSLEDSSVFIKVAIFVLTLYKENGSKI